MRVFLGVTGASGALYAGGALRALTGAEAAVVMRCADGHDVPPEELGMRVARSR